MYKCRNKDYCKIQILSEFYVKALQTDWNALKIVKYFVKSPPSTFMRCLQLIYMFKILIEHRAWMLKSLGTLQTRSLPLHYRGDQLLGADWWGREGRSSRALKKRSRSLKPGADPWRREAGSQLSRWRHRLLFAEQTSGLAMRKPKIQHILPLLLWVSPFFPVIFPTHNSTTRPLTLSNNSSFFGWVLFLWFLAIMLWMLRLNRLHCRTMEIVTEVKSIHLMASWLDLLSRY